LEKIFFSLPDWATVRSRPARSLADPHVLSQKLLAPVFAWVCHGNHCQKHPCPSPEDTTTRDLPGDFNARGRQRLHLHFISREFPRHFRDSILRPSSAGTPTQRPAPPLRTSCRSSYRLTALSTAGAPINCRAPPEGGLATGIGPVLRARRSACRSTCRHKAAHPSFSSARGMWTPPSSLLPTSEGVA
jgi:hypothetical protein